MRNTLSGMTLCLSIGVAGGAGASEDGLEKGTTVAHALSVGATGNNLAPIGGVVGYRIRPFADLQLGVELMGAKRYRSYIGGYAADGGADFGGVFLVQGTVLHEGPLTIDVRGDAGARYTNSGDGTVPDAEAISVLVDVSVLAHIAANDWLTVRTGWTSPFALAASPIVDVETTGFLTLGGLGLAVSPNVSLTVDGHVGGVFGFSGDGAKLSAGGQLGLRWLFGTDTRAWRNY